MRLWLFLLLVNLACSTNTPSSEPTPRKTAAAERELVRANGNMALEAREASGELYLQALTLGEMTELKTHAWDFSARLYAIPVSDDCVPETHSICGYRYLLTLATHDENPEVRGYDLGVVGEIADVRFIGKETEEVYRAALTVSNYPRVSLQANRELVSRTEQFELEMTERSVRVRRRR